MTLSYLYVSTFLIKFNYLYDAVLFYTCWLFFVHAMTNSQIIIFKQIWLFKEAALFYTCRLFLWACHDKQSNYYFWLFYHPCILLLNQSIKCFGWPIKYSNFFFDYFKIKPILVRLLTKIDFLTKKNQLKYVFWHLLISQKKT